jgi:hypothetical protein
MLTASLIAVTVRDMPTPETSWYLRITTWNYADLEYRAFAEPKEYMF